MEFWESSLYADFCFLSRFSLFVVRGSFVVCIPGFTSLFRVVSPIFFRRFVLSLFSSFLYGSVFLGILA